MARVIAVPAGSATWSSTDVLRIAVDGRGVIGFIEVGATSSLADARQKIVAEVDGLSDTNIFQFQLPDAVPISRKQEEFILARDFVPVIHLRLRNLNQRTGSSRSLTNSSGNTNTTPFGTPRQGPVGTPRQGPSTLFNNGNTNGSVGASSNGQHILGTTSSYVSSKVTVSFLGEAYHIWVTTGYTFAQLRREAARYWSFAPEHVVLMDEDGCAWPDSGIVSSVLETGMLDRREILLVRKPGSGFHDLNHVETSQRVSTLSAANQAELDRLRSSRPNNVITTNNLGQQHASTPRVQRSLASGPIAGGPANLTSASTPKAKAQDVTASAIMQEISTLQQKQQRQEKANTEFETPKVDALVHLNGSVTLTGGSTEGDEEDDRVSVVNGAQELCLEADDEANPFTLDCNTPKSSAAMTTIASTNHQDTSVVKVVVERYADLWRAFTYYCTQIDSNRPFSMDRRGFFGVLQDCQLVDDQSFSPAKLNLIFTASCKNGKQSNRMYFEDFLEALMKITRKIKDKQTGRKQPSSPQHRPMSTTERIQEERSVLTNFVQLLMQIILPRAATWNVHKWDMHSRLADRPEVLETLQTFAKPMYEIFSFYAPAVHSNKLDMETDACFYWNTFSAFALDFQFAELNIRPFLAEIYVCSAHHLPLPYKGKPSSSQGARLVMHTGADTAEYTLDHDRANSPFKHHRQHAKALEPLVKDGYLLQHATGEPIWERPILQFGQFLAALLRVAWYAFPDLANSRNPELAVKALMQHFSKCLRKSYVVSLLEKRQNVSRYPIGLLQGTEMLYKRYMDMWKRDGQPDYLLQDSPEAEDLQGFGFVTHSPLASPYTAMDLASPHTLTCTPAPRRRSQSTGSRTSGSRKSHENFSVGDGRRILEELLAAEEARTAGGNPNGPAISALLGLQPPKSSTQSRTGFGLFEGVEDADVIQQRLEGFLHDDDAQLYDEPLDSTTRNLNGENSSVMGGNTASGPASLNGNSSILDGDLKNFDQASFGDGDTVGGPGSPRFSLGSQSPTDLHLKTIDGLDTVSEASKSIHSTAANYNNNNMAYDSDHSLSETEEKLRSVSDNDTSGEDDMSSTRARPTTKRKGESNSSNRLQEILQNENGSLTLQSVDLLGRVSQPTYELLCQGGVFLKHGRRGYPHRRFVWCDERLQNVYWCSVDRKPTKNGPRTKARSMSIFEIAKVSSGLETDRLQRLLKHSTAWNFRHRSRAGSTDSSIDVKRVLCFSLHGKDRTLDLEADSEDLRKEWIEAFEEILTLKKRTAIVHSDDDEEPDV